MQVSWIDEVRLKELLHELREATPPVKAGPLAWEVHTLPEAAKEDPAMEDPSFVPETGADERRASGSTEADSAFRSATSEDDEPEEELAKGPVISPEIERIRDRLKAIREKALQAGLLTRPSMPAEPVEVPSADEAVAEIEESAAPEVPEPEGQAEPTVIEEVETVPADPEPVPDERAVEEVVSTEVEAPAEEEQVEEEVKPTWADASSRAWGEVTPPSSVFQRVEMPEEPAVDEVTPEEGEAAEVDEEADVNEAAEVECETAVDEGAEVEVEHFEVPTSSSPFQMASISPTEVKSTDVIEVPPLPVMPEQEPAEEVEETVTEQEEDDGLGEGVDESDEDDGFYFEVPLGTVVERLDAFAGWAQRRLGDGELMLVDDHGDLLWGAQARAGVVLSTLLATRAMSRSSAAAACHTPLVHTQPTGSDLLLSVVSCPTRVGVLHLAVLQAEALDEDEATLLKQALQSSIDVTG